MIRTFIALEIPEDLRETLTLLRRELQKELRGEIKWVAPENLHITLHFIGVICKSKVSKIEQKLVELFSELKPFYITDPKLELVPTLNNPKIYWLSVSPTNVDLCVFVRKIRDFLSEMEIRVDNRPFRSHVTIGRIKRDLTKAFKSKLLTNTISTEQWKIKEATLYESCLHPNGPQYRKIRTFCLQEEER